jgi:glutaredoxin
MTATDRQVTLMTRTGCHLCEDAATLLRALARELGFAYDERDIDADPALRERYGEYVPVILIDGREHGYWRVEPDRFRAAVQA